jgi:anti-anti-sigma factor
VRADAELNSASLAAFEAQIDQIAGAEFANVLLDVTALSKFDAVGTRVLIGLDHYVEALGARLTITGVSRQVADALAHTHLIPTLAPGLGAQIDRQLSRRCLTTGGPSLCSAKSLGPSATPD